MTTRPSTEAIATRLAPRKRPRSAVRRTLGNPVALGAVLFLVVMLLAGVFAPLVAPVNPNHTNLDAVNAAAFSPGHVLGGDASGRDIFSRLVHGIRATALACVLVLGVSLLVGVPSGLIAGYYQGRVEAVVLFLFDAIQSLPGIVLLIALYVLTGPNTVAAMSVFGVLVAPTFFRLVRASVVEVRNELYIDAAKVVGLSDLRIVSKHVLWAVRGPVVIQSAFTLGFGIAIQAGVDFLGLGDPSRPSWGRALQDSFDNIYAAPSAVIWPALVITLAILALVLLGNALRDAFEAGAASHRLTAARRRALTATTPAAPTASRSEDAPLLTVSGLHVGYPDSATTVREVVRGASLSVRRGEIRGLVGESGSGKSQIAFSVLGLLPKEAVTLGGHIGFDGRSLLNDPKALGDVRGSRIAYIPQDPMSNLDPSFTIGHQLVQGLRAARTMNKAHARARVRSLLERVGIRDPDRVMRQYPHEISGGMAQRVLICGAIAPDPDFVVADEPTTALDVTVQAEVLEILRALSTERGLAMVLVTHNLGVVADLCHTVSVMQDGRIVEEGDVESVFAAPKNPYTQDLLASSRQVEIEEVVR